MQHKLLQIDQIDVKFTSEQEGIFSGYASVFGGVDAYGDTIIKGAYANTLENRKRPVQMRWNHYGDVIGKWLKIEEDEKGLYVEGSLTPNHSLAQDVYASLKHGSIGGLSIGYRVVKGLENTTGGLDLQEIDLVEISVVESPADIAAQIDEVKSNIKQAESLKEIEAILRDAGNFTRTDATALVARIKAITLGEQEKIAETSETNDAIKAALMANINKLKGV
jgi:HK97 family phage prohead protease